MELKEVTNSSGKVYWNPKVKLILADIDDTIATPYESASDEMIQELTGLLKEGKKFFFVTGGGFQRAQKRIIEKIFPQHLRSGILIAHCSGAEVVGYDTEGHLRTEPFYSLLEQKLTSFQQDQWRQVMDQLINKTGLKTIDPIPEKQFIIETNKDPRVVMYDDRGPQITFELPNSISLTADQVKTFGIDPKENIETYDLRDQLILRGERLLKEKELPLQISKGGVFALDFVLQGVSKTTAVEAALSNPEILSSTGLTLDDIHNPEELEVWGDRFAGEHAGDVGMLSPLPKGVRAINFRKEDPKMFPREFNIVNWVGESSLAAGALEYIRSRHD